MPLQGADFSVRQRQVLRAAADIVNPGMTDAQVLAWATGVGAVAAVRRARDLAAATLNERHNAERAALLTPLEDEDDAE